MRLEALTSFTYRWPGGEVHLEPGKPIDLPDDRAKRLLSKAPNRVRVVTSAVQAGSFVFWRRADGTHPEGFVDAIHVDDIGTRWAFVSLAGETWAAVNVKFLKEVKP